MEIRKKDFWNFAKYLFIGILVSLLNIFFSWIFIDFIGMKALLSSTIIGITIFLIKYFSYTRVNLIKRRMGIFLLITTSSVVAYILFTTILIDLLRVPTLIAVPFVVAFLFILRFFVFYWTKIIKK